MVQSVTMGTKAEPRSRRWRERLHPVPWRVSGWSFAAPGLLLLAIVIGIPLVYALCLSFSSFTLIHQRLWPFVGLRNFASVLSDPFFWHSLSLTIQYTFWTVALEFGLGLLVALMLDKVVRLRAFYFMVLAIPLAMSPVSVALIWRMLLQTNFGIVNAVLRGIGLGDVDWLGSPDTAFWSVVFIDVWQQVSLVTLILAAGLASLPKEPFEAAEIDGAGVLARFWHLTLPMLRPVASIVLIIQTINELRTYDLIYVLTKGGPGVSTELLSFMAYKRAFLGLAANEGAANAILLMLVALLLSIVFFMTVSKKPG